MCLRCAVVRSCVEDETFGGRVTGTQLAKGSIWGFTVRAIWSTFIQYITQYQVEQNMERKGKLSGKRGFTSYIVYTWGPLGALK